MADRHSPPWQEPAAPTGLPRVPSIATIADRFSDLERTLAAVGDLREASAGELEVVARFARVAVNDAEVLLAEVSRLRAELDEAESRADATRAMANAAYAALRSRLLAALGRDDDGRTQLVEYVDDLTADRDALRAQVAEHEHHRWVDRHEALEAAAAGGAEAERRVHEQLWADLLALHSPKPGWERDWKDPAEALAKGWPLCAGCELTSCGRLLSDCPTRKILLATVDALPSTPPGPSADLLARSQARLRGYRDAIRRLRQCGEDRAADLLQAELSEPASTPREEPTP